MKNILKSLTISLIISLSISFISLAFNEGMISVSNTSKEQTWAYLTGKENEYGYPEYLTNQWKQVWDNWYYFGEDGKSKQNTWAEIDGKWYYFDQWSVMLHDTTTPDGYYVGADGAWVQ